MPAATSPTGSGSTPATSPLVEVRVNAGDDDDVAAARRRSAATFGVRIPKVESPDDIDRVVDAMGRDVPVTALIETARGIEAALAIAAHPMVTSLTRRRGRPGQRSRHRRPRRARLGRSSASSSPLAPPGKPPPVAPVYTDIKDLDGLAADTAGWRTMGFLGRAAIHPSQVPVIAAAFRPTDAEVAWAREVLAAIDAGGVTTLASGEMVDPAMRGRAEAIVALAELGSPR